MSLARFELPLALGLLALLSWVAQFHHFHEFGLYEDDYFFIAQAMGKDPDYLAERLKVFVTLPQGRPFGFFLPDLLSFIGDKLGGLDTIYLLGFVIVVTNSFLFYKLLRARVPVVIAGIGAAAFCVFPADTTKILLTHDFQLQPSLTFVLVASLLYLAGRKPLAYVVSAGSLLSYESGFLPFLALPLLIRRWDRQTLRELVRHALVVLAVLIAVVLVRYLAGEGRATQSVGTLSEIIPKLAGSIVLGPARSVALLLFGPLKAVSGWDLETIGLAVATFVITGLLVYRIGRCAASQSPWMDALQVGGAGVVMLVLAYGLAFTHYPPTAVVGRGTSVHLGATVGGATIVAALAWLGLMVRVRLASGLIATYVALIVGYYVTIQRDFIHAWQLQRTFWQEVVACCSDLQDGTVLLYESDGTAEPTFIFSNSWADPLVLALMYRFPPQWATPPRLFSLTAWTDRVQPDGDHLRWWVPGASWDEHWEEFPAANVIVLRPGGGHLQRIEGSVDIAGTRFALKPLGVPAVFAPGPLHDLLLAP